MLKNLSKINLANDDWMKNPYPEGFGKVTIPEGESGDWKVSRFNVTKDESMMFNLRLIRDGMGHRIVPLGTYTRLTRDRTVVMSDTPAEAHEHARAFYRASGRVLVNGLGLGFFVSAILSKSDITEIVVIEKSPDVINLVGRYIFDPRVTIIEADALEWRPKKGEHFDFVWHDIWDEICEDNKSEMSKLRRSYAKRCNLQNCWSEEYLR